MPVEVVSGDPISSLAEEYKKDLDRLDEFDPLISAKMINIQDVKLLQKMCNKYKLKERVTVDNFSEVSGRLGAVILDREEDLAIRHVLERVREEMPSRMPRERRIVKEKIPEAIKK